MAEQYGHRLDMVELNIVKIVCHKHPQSTLSPLGRQEGDNGLHGSMNIIQHHDRRKNRTEEEQEGMDHLEV